MTTAGSDEAPPPPPAAPPPLPGNMASNNWSEDGGDSPTPEQQQQQHRNLRQDDSPYVSSASSNDLSSHDKFVVPEGTPPLIRHRNSSSGDFVVPPPQHPFGASAFPAFYDSDGSDGSLVFSYPRGTTPPATYDLPNSMSSPRIPLTAQQQHERWGSMDSVGSFSREQQLSPMHLPGTTTTPQPQHLRQHAASPQNYNPQTLPYHQRRKLLQKRQRQQRQQQQQQQAGSQPIVNPDTVASAFVGGLYSQHARTPASRARTAFSSEKISSGDVSSSVKKHSPTYQSKRPIPLDTISPTLQQQRPTPKQYPPHPPPAPPPPPPPLPHPHSLPPSGHSRSYSGSNNSGLVANRGRISSVDSNSSEQSWHRRRSQEPPPPPPPPYSHIRADSSGSISSLGSTSDHASTKNTGSLTDRLDQDIIGFLQEEKHRGNALPPPPPPPPAQQQQQQQYRAQKQQQRHQRNSNGGSGFLMGFFNLSPKQSNKPTNVEEYHQRNQAFLQRAEMERAKLALRQQQLQSTKQPLKRSPRPPNSRGVHRPGLSSIDNDNWEDEHDEGRTSKHKNSFKRYPPPQEEEEEEAAAYASRPVDRAATAILKHDRYLESATSSFVSSSQDDDDESDDEASSSGMDRLSSSNLEIESDEANERTSLLPPSGISSQEGKRSTYTTEKKAPSPRGSSRRTTRLEWESRQETVRWDNRQVGAMSFKKGKGRGKYRRRKGKKDRSRSRRHRQPSSSNTDESDEFSDDASHSSSSSSSHYDYKRWAKKRAKMFEKERTKLIAEWKAEAKAEAEAARKAAEENRWYRRLARWLDVECVYIVDRILKFLATAETFICNLPLTIGAVALAIATLGVVWFKFAEENLASCQPVHFHSSQCTFPEFPGCFYCDKHTKMYRVALNFHFVCSALSGVLAMGFVAKVILAYRVVVDEMSSPTTSSPAGLICMTTVCVFAGRGWIGQILVSVAASLHLGLVIWFIYMALAYHIMPEPSWYPNTVGIGLSAVKTWLYYPMPGHFLMAISLSLNFFFFPISLIRVTLNKKISAPVCWIQMSAPAISLYALTIMAQPSFEEEHPDVTRFQRVHRMVYLPCMHFLFVLAVVGVLSSVQSLATRWKKFRKHEFSPAHAAFCFPTLAHANAIQAYRAAVDAFSEIEPGSPFKVALYAYWVLVLMSGTLATLYVTARFFYHLPSWTQVDVADEEEPPAPNETMLRDVIATGETLRQKYVSPAVLQANETGALVFLRRGDEDGRGRYVRTRRLPALGFEPTMNWSEMNAEREVLLEWVAQNPPRRRKKTLSVPGIDFNYGFGDFGTGNSGVYGVEEGHNRGLSVPSRERSSTFDDSYRNMRGGYY